MNQLLVDSTLLPKFSVNLFLTNILYFRYKRYFFPSGLAEPDTSVLDRLGMSFHLYSPFLKLDHATYLNFIRECTASFAQPYSISDGDFENDALGDLPWYVILTAIAAASR